MQLNMYCVYDDVSKTSAPPFFSTSDEFAIRNVCFSMTNLANPSGVPYDPRHMRLFRIGSYDESLLNERFNDPDFYELSFSDSELPFYLNESFKCFGTLYDLFQDYIKKYPEEPFKDLVTYLKGVVESTFSSAAKLPENQKIIQDIISNS